MEIATQVQARLFPQKMPHLRTLEYHGVCIQARQVGGDYYDFLDLGRERFGLVIADIAGKGIGAALLMANLQANLRSQCALVSDQMQNFLQSVNQLFYENTTDTAYATFFFAEYDDQTRCLRYAKLWASLPLSPSARQQFGATATNVNRARAFEQWNCSIEETRLFPGDILVLYTDGLTEASNEEGEEFGEERLCNALRRHRDLSSQSLLASIVDEVRLFNAGEQQDDITVMVANCRRS